MGSRAAKDKLFEEISALGKAFSSPRRLELIDLLAQGPRSVDQLAQASGLSVANVSQHLQGLHASGVVSRRRQGARVHYSLAGEDVLTLWLVLRDTAAGQLAGVERAAAEYLGEPVEAIDSEELCSRLSRGEVTLVDVRPAEEFGAGHIEGAHSIPLDELERRIAELPPGREVIAYCRGPLCAYAHEAVRVLRGAGYPARRLEEGVPEWRRSEAARDLEKTA